MGRYAEKEEADFLLKIEIWWLRKYGYLQGLKSGRVEWTHGWSGNKNSIGIYGVVSETESYIRFTYTTTDYNGEKTDFDYKIHLTTTSCNYGGIRYWFTCPFSKNGIYCGRRVGVLYKGGKYFACRHCYDLTYSSRRFARNSAYSPLFGILEAEKLEEKLKRRYYAGKPTKRYRRVLRLYSRYAPQILGNKGV